MDNKTVCQYENTEHCVVNISEKYLSLLPRRDIQFYFRLLSDDASGIPRFGNQSVGQNWLAQVISEMCKAAGIQSHKTGHSEKVTCATALYQQNFSDQVIKERTGHHSLEALHKYKHTGSDQQCQISMVIQPESPKTDQKKRILTQKLLLF